MRVNGRGLAVIRGNRWEIDPKLIDVETIED